MSNPADVSLFGVLVRDVEPRAKDLNKRAKALGEGCPATTSIELRAIYLPENTICSLGKLVAKRKVG